MDIWKIDKLVLFFALVIPEFISIKAYQLAFPGTERVTPDQLIDAIASRGRIWCSDRSKFEFI